MAKMKKSSRPVISRPKSSLKTQVVKRETRASLLKAAANAKVWTPSISPTLVAELIQWKAEFQNSRLVSISNDKENRPKTRALRGTDRRRKVDHDDISLKPLKVEARKEENGPDSNATRTCKTSKRKPEAVSPQTESSLKNTLMYALLGQKTSLVLNVGNLTSKGRRPNVARGNEMCVNKKWTETVEVSTGKV